jgi:hypothetical protein
MARPNGRLNDDETVRRRSGWLIPLCIFGVTFVLSAVLLVYYLAPRGDALFNEQATPVSRNDIVTLSVGGKPFHIPANYLIYESARRGGEHPKIVFFALLPDLDGWSNWAADSFESDAPDSRVVYYTLHTDRQGLKETDRLARVLLDYVVDRHGRPGPFGLTQYEFRTDTGYRGDDLLVGQTEAGPVVLRCVKPAPEVPSPNCLREELVAPNLSLSVRFKRSYLENWHDIAVRTDKLIAKFREAPHPAAK